MPVLLIYNGVNNASGRYTLKYLIGDIVPNYVRKKALKPGRKKLECTRAQMIGTSPDVQFGIWFTIGNVGSLSGKWDEIPETLI